MHVTVVITAYNRAPLLSGAVDAALAQTHRDLDVLVIDDGSTDGTAVRLEAYAQEPRVTVVRRAANGGAAAAMNLGLALATGAAITFHDSDDVPSRDKVAAQAAALDMSGRKADPRLNWGAIGRKPGEPLSVDAALCAHVFVGRDGAERIARCSLSLVEDLLPNVFAGGDGAGDSLHVPAGLFRRGLFERLGGFAPSVEAGRDLRNRILRAGGIVELVARPLLTKFESPGSLSLDPRTDARSARRARDRAACWARLRATEDDALVEPIDLGGAEIADVRGAAPRARLNRRLPLVGVHPSFVVHGLVGADDLRDPSVDAAPAAAAG